MGKIVNDELYSKMKGVELFELHESGDLDASYWFAKLVFEGKAAPEEGITKKEQRGLARIGSESAITNAADSGHYPSMVEAADMYFSGRREPGQFGSAIFCAQYQKSKEWYLKLLGHPDSSEEFKSLATFRLGMLSYMSTNTVTDEVLALWEEASKSPFEGGIFAISRIAQHYYDKKDYVKSVPLLESIYEKRPYSAILLALCFKYGYGVDVDLKRHDELIAYWEENS